MPGRKEQLQRELKHSAKNCIGLGDYFSKHTKKTTEPQEEVELLKKIEDEEQNYQKKMRMTAQHQE